MGIPVALGVNLAHVRSRSGSERAGAFALLYANAALAIWYFHIWIRLLTLEAGETTSVPHEVIWQCIAMLLPLVLATTGWRLWREHGRDDRLDAS